MNIKRVILILLLIGVISSLSIVNAQDANITQDLQSPPTSIYDAVDEAQDNDVINLENKTYNTLDDTEITIDKSISLIGSDNTVIDGQNKDYLFKITDNVNVTFENIKFINAFKKADKNQDGFGAALEINKANVIIKNCQFIGNSISYGEGDSIYGGAISNFGNLTIINSYFLNNSINSNMDHDGFGGAIYNKGNLNIDNSSFINSKGATYSKGSAIYNDGITIINNSIIANTYSKEESMGSAIFNNANLTLLNSIIENNTIERNNFNYIYGNIFNSGFLTARGNIFRNNTAYYKQPNSGYAGCPMIYNVGVLNLTYNAFIDNIGGFEKVYTDVFLNGGNDIYINNNWWGNNENPYSNKKINEDKATSWIVLDVTPEYSSIAINQSIDIVASWKTSDGFTSDFQMPFGITFKTNFNQISSILTNESIFTFSDTQIKGLYEVNVTINSYMQTVLVDVGKINSHLNCSVKSEIYPNEYLVVSISLFDDDYNPIDGKITINLNDQKRVVTLEGGQIKTVFSKLIPDNYHLTLTYEGNDIYSKAFNQTDVIVKKYPIDISIDDIGEVKVATDFTVNIRLNTSECEGPANLYINGAFKDIIYLATGLNPIIFSNFKEGQYNITVEVAGDEYYQKTQTSTILNVSRYTTLLNLTCDNITIGENATLKINSANEFIGNVILSINGYNTTLFLENKTNEFTLANLGAGIYDVDLVFDGNDLYAPFKTKTSFEVLKLQSHLDVEIKNNTMFITAIPSNCTGTITLHINQKQFIQNLTNGKANFTFKLENGTNYIYVIYSGDYYYNQSSWNTTIGEGEAYALIASNITAWEYNNFTYSVQLFEENGMAMPNKIITIEVNSKTYDVKTNNKGIAILNLNLKVGDYKIISTYNNLIAKNTITIKPIEFNLTSADVTYGEDLLIEAAFDKNITGYVNFTLNNISNISDIHDGKATWTIKNPECGIYKIKANYFNDLITLNSQETIVNVNKLDSNITVNISEVSIGQDEIISIKTDNLTGTVKVMVDEEEYLLNITNNQVNLTLSDLSKGIHNLTIYYGGDNHHKNTTIYQNFIIKSSKTDIVLKINNTEYMQDIIVIAKVNSNATGSILFTLNDLKFTSQINDGIAVWNFTGINVGKYTVYANYLGDDDFISSKNSTSFKVTKAKSTIEVYVIEACLDENIRIYAKLSPNATGKVSFRMKDYYSPRDKDIVDSVASWLISPLESGQYVIYATYRGDNNYYSSSAEYILNLYQVRSYISLEVNDASNNDGVSIKVKLFSDNGSITGVVKLNIDNKNYDVRVNNGNGALVIGKLKPGNYTVKASFEGNDNYSSSSTASSFNVYDSLIETTINLNSVVKYYNGDADLIISLVNVRDRPISGAELIVNIDGTEKIYITDSDGKIYINTDYPLGKHLVNVKYAGSNSYHQSQANATIDVLSTIESEDLTKLYGTGNQYFSMFKDLSGKALMNTKVFFKILGKTYEYTTLPNGVVRLNINLNPGTYYITAINPVTGENKVNKITIFNKLMGNKDITNYFGAKSTYKVRAFDINGKAIGAGKIVTFKVNVKTYKVKTDKNGYAKVSLKLKVNSYTITAEFNGTKVSNKIIVKPVLTTKITFSKKTKKTKFTAKLINAKGKPVKGKKITFKIKGKKYKIKTNKKGIAILNIKLKLKKGTHKVYTIYGKSKVVNKIKVK